MNIKNNRFNILNIFLVLLVLLAGSAAYFTFIKPIQFSNLIMREGVMRYAEVEILLPDDLTWLKDTVPIGLENRNVYNAVTWKVMGFEEKLLGEKRWVAAKVKLAIVEKSSGILAYGKYILVKGNKIYLISDDLYLEGRIFNYQLLNEKILR